jgi:hypothetical protein
MTCHASCCLIYSSKGLDDTESMEKELCTCACPHMRARTCNAAALPPAQSVLYSRPGPPKPIRGCGENLPQLSGPSPLQQLHESTALWAPDHNEVPVTCPDIHAASEGHTAPTETVPRPSFLIRRMTTWGCVLSREVSPQSPRCRANQGTKGTRPEARGASGSPRPLSDR